MAKPEEIAIQIGDKLGLDRDRGVIAEQIEELLLTTYDRILQTIEFELREEKSPWIVSGLRFLYHPLQYRGYLRRVAGLRLLREKIRDLRVADLVDMPRDPPS